MPSTFALAFSKFALDLGKFFVRGDVRLHNLDKLEDDMAIVFVVNHFTRLETLLLPYELFKATGMEVMGLAADELFQGRIGQFLRSTLAISTKDPDRDKIIVRSLLEGKQPWMIFPEGSMIKDKKVVDHAGEFAVYSAKGRRPPHTGAAVVALRAEFFRRQLARLASGDRDGGRAALPEWFDIEPDEGVLRKRTVIVPVNITYYPMRSGDNFLLRLATRYAGELSPRMVEELSVEGTVLAEDTDIDITFGDPIAVAPYLDAAPGPDLSSEKADVLPAEEVNPESRFNTAAKTLMRRYMEAIYSLTTLNYDHLFATLLRFHRESRFTERELRTRAFLAAHEIKACGRFRMHRLLSDKHPDLLSDEYNERLACFLDLCAREEILVREGPAYRRHPGKRVGEPDFHRVRTEDLCTVIANELEPLRDAVEMVKRAARLPKFMLQRRVRSILVDADQRRFERDYAAHYDHALSKGPEVGRPFLLRPLRPRAGMVLAHGYMAAPLEIRAMADYFVQRGYAVYGVRLAGHGTSPEDLAKTSWADWYESFNRGYAALRTLTDHIVLAGFSTGGCLALLGAARKGLHVEAAVSICAPLQVRNFSIRFVPSVVAVNSLLKRIGRNRVEWEYVENAPENRHINYTKNPLTGVRELVEVMGAMEERLPEVRVPALIVQSSGDTVVNPVSAQEIFAKTGSENRELTVFARDRHGIVNGPGKEAVFERVDQFLEGVFRARDASARRTGEGWPAAAAVWRRWRQGPGPERSEAQAGEKSTADSGG